MRITNNTTLRGGRASNSAGRLGRWLLSFAAAALLGSGQALAAAEAEGELGLIPGTSMHRDEFRGKALAQLNAIALNALAYELVNSEYPADFAHLRASAAWNIDVQNMFTDQRLRSISFDPQPGDFTSAPANGFLPAVEMPVLRPQAPPPGQGGATGGPAGSPAGPGQIIPIAGSNSALARVDPKVIQDFVPGDVFYYAKGALLQLVIFAPDHTYVEWVDEIPNTNLREGISLSTVGTSFPADMYSLQVLYYVENLLPQYLGLVRFMGSEDSPPAAALEALSAAERLPLAQEYKVTVLNPFTREAARATAETSPGDFALADGGNDVPLVVYLSSGVPATAADLRAKGSLVGTEPPADKPGKTKPPVKDSKPRRPRPGGGRPVH